MNYKLQFNDHEQQGGSIIIDVPALCVNPVLLYLVPVALSTLQIPAILPRSRKTLEFWGAGYGIGTVSDLPCYLIHCGPIAK